MKIKDFQVILSFDKYQIGMYIIFRVKFLFYLTIKNYDVNKIKLPETLGMKNDI